MARLKPLRIILEAVDKLTAPIDRVTKKIDGMTGPVRRVHTALGKLGKATGLNRLGNAIGYVARRAALLGGALAGAAAFGFKKFVSSAEEMLNTADKIGISVERLQGLRFWAEIRGVSLSGFNSGLLQFSKRIGELRSAQGGMFTALKKSNPELLRQIFHAKDTSEAFDIAVAAIERASSATEKAALANAFFGRSGADMRLAALRGADGIRTLEAEARKLGVILDRTTLERMDAMEDKWTAIKARILAVGRAIAANVLPAIEGLTDDLSKWLASNQGNLREWAADFGKNLGDGITNIANSIKRLADRMGGLKGSLDRIADFTDKISGAIDFISKVEQKGSGFRRGLAGIERWAAQNHPFRLKPEGSWAPTPRERFQSWLGSAVSPNPIPSQLNVGKGEIKITIDDQRARVSRLRTSSDLFDLSADMGRVFSTP